MTENKNEFKLTINVEVNDGFKKNLELEDKEYVKTWPKNKFIKFDKKLQAYILKDSLKNQETIDFLNKCKLKYIKEGFKKIKLEDISKSLDMLCDDGFTTTKHALLKIHVTFKLPRLTDDIEEKVRVEEIDVFVKIRELITILQNEYLIKNKKEFVKEQGINIKPKLKKTPDKIIFIKK